MRQTSKVPELTENISSEGWTAKRLCSRLSITLFCALDPAAAVAQSYETMSRCFFVYAAVVEVGRDWPHAQLFRYGQYRMNWFTEYLEQNQSNADFSRTFEAHLSNNKRLAEDIKASLQEAITSASRVDLDVAMYESRDCDDALGISGNDVPEY